MTSNKEQWFLRVFITLENEWNKIRGEQKFHAASQYFTEQDEDHTLFLSTFYPKIYQQILKDHLLREYYLQPQSSRWYKVMEDNPNFHKRFNCWRNGEPRLCIYPATPEETKLAQEHDHTECKEQY
jgi:hypothetical protein